MKILMVYPECPDTFWSLKHIIDLFGKKASFPPLGLMTISSILPAEFEKRLVDLNTSKLSDLPDEEILRADFVFISAMIVQRESALEVIDRCKKLGVKTVAGGPLFTSLHEQFEDVDHFILNEGEVTIPLFLEDLKKGKLKRVYTSEVKPELCLTPVPDYSLINPGDYYMMLLQSSRGCPFDCDFCDIVNLNGRKPRSKSPEQVIRELEEIKSLGWRQSVFFVDDNFLGNIKKTKELLGAIIEWRQRAGFEPLFYTEISINASDDDELLDLLRQAGFFMVFVGIETPSTESLEECHKTQNQNRDLLGSVRKFYEYGIEVTGGFIVGFDSDDETIFQRQLDFIQEAGVVKAMIEILQALPGTKLYKRLEAEGRLLLNSSGVCQDSTTNFIPKLDKDLLVKGYNELVHRAYSPRYYFERVASAMKYYRPNRKIPLHKRVIPSIIKIYIILKYLKKGRMEFGKFITKIFFRNIKCFPAALDHSVLYIHFSRVFN